MFGEFLYCLALVILTMWFAGRSIDAVIWAHRYPPGDTVGGSGFHAVVAWCLFGSFAVWGVYTRGRFPRDWANYGRLFYTWAFLLFLLHIAVAFNVRHQWSHEKAFDHVETVSGFGPGIYVNYLFAAIWLADVVWAWVALDHYLNRPRWLSWSVLAFMAFIVFNAAVVFGTGNWRIVSAVLFLIPLYALWATHPWVVVSTKTSEPGTWPGSGDAARSTNSHSPT
jgi:hypothetical protein